MGKLPNKSFERTREKSARRSIRSLGIVRDLMSRNVTCACIAVAAYLASAGAEAALRCGNLLAQEGDSSAAVLQKCGEPSFTQSYCEEPPTKKEDAPVVVPCEAVEEWTYNPAAGQLTPTLKFKRGKLESIRYGQRAP
jgi:hypothetical protein